MVILIQHGGQPGKAAVGILVEKEQEERPQRHVAQIGLGVEVADRAIGRHA